jgi:hypothetical protein
MNTGKSEKRLVIRNLSYDFTVCKVTDYAGVDANAPYCFIGKEKRRIL